MFTSNSRREESKSLNAITNKSSTEKKEKKKKILTDFKVGGFKCGAGEEPRKHHVYGDGEAVTDVSFSYLDVLDLCGVSSVSLRAA